MNGFRFATTEKVIWRDQDALGHVNNAVYSTYFETARLEYLSEVLGNQFRVTGLILAEITVTFKSPAVLGESLEIGARTVEIRNSSFVQESEIREQKTGRLIATSRATIVCFDYDANRPVPVPGEWRERIAGFEGRPF